MGKSVKKGTMKNGIRRVGDQWYPRAELGEDPITGKRLRREKAWRTYKEARAWKTEIEAQAVQGVILRGNEPLGAWLVRWLDENAAGRKPSTLRNLSGILNKYFVGKPISKVLLRNLTPEHVVRFMASLPSQGSVRQRVLSLLKAALGEAEDRELVRRNVARNKTVARMVQPPVKRTDYWNEAEVIALLDHVDARPPIELARGRPFGFSGMSPLVHLGFGSGLREGELLALEWPDIDFKAGTLSVTRQLSAQPLQVLPYLKAEREQKVIDIDPEVLERLRAWKRAQMEERLAAGPAWLSEHMLAGEPQPNRFVFTYTNGCPVHPGTFPGWFAKLVAEANLPWRKVHGMRHAHAFVLLNNGWTLEKVSRRLGHASTRVTDESYGHILRSRAPVEKPLSFTEALRAARQVGGSRVAAGGSEGGD